MVVIGDVHGAYKTLLALLEQFPEGEEPVFVGDLVDRGPASREVVELVKSKGWKCTLGNHEHMMLDHYGLGNDPIRYDYGVWLYNGGGETRDSYEGYADQLSQHLTWMQSLPLYLDLVDVKDESGRSLFVSHTGVKPYGPITAYKLEEAAALTSFNRLDDSIIWYRGKPAHLDNRFHIFGHTPRKTPDIQQYYANVDTGAGRRQTLTGIQFPSMKIFTQPYCG